MSRLKVASAPALVLVVAMCAEASAQSAGGDPVLAGYMRLYAGSPEDAQSHFEAVRASDRHALPAWFGSLFALQVRVEHDESLGDAFEAGIQSFISHAEQRYARSRADAEAVFYLAQAYLLRSTYRFNFDKGVWGAARDAARSKGFADEYVKRYPGHGDAYLALGLYNYFVDIAPNFVKVLRVLLLLPAGSRTEGLKQLERAAREGSMFAPLAEAALADIYGALEGRLAEAIPLAERFIRRFPANADMRLELAALYLHPSVEAYQRAAQQYQHVLEAATTASARHVSERYRASLGLANVRRSQWRIEEAIALLGPTIDQKPVTPAWVLPTALLRRANYRMLINDPGAAADARRVLADAKMSTFHKTARQTLAAIAARAKTNEGTIYAALLPGQRLVVEDRFDEAKAFYESVGARHPGDWQVRYRLAYLEFARGRYDVAAQQLQVITTSRAPMPAWLRAAAMLTLAWTHDIAGRRAEAVRLYRIILDDYEDEAPAGAAQLGLIAPYRGPIHIPPGGATGHPPATHASDTPMTAAGCAGRNVGWREASGCRRRGTAVVAESFLKL